MYLTCTNSSAQSLNCWRGKHRFRSTWILVGSSLVLLLSVVRRYMLSSWSFASLHTNLNKCTKTKDRSNFGFKNYPLQQIVPINFMLKFSVGKRQHAMTLRNLKNSVNDRLIVYSAVKPGQSLGKVRS